LITSREPKKRSFIFTSLPFFILAHAAHHFVMALQQPLFPAIRDYFKIGTYFQASYVPFVFSLANATGQLPAGWFADRFGPIPLIFIGTFGVAIAGILIGVSPNFVMFLIFLMLMGLLAGGYHPAATPLISASVEPQQRGRALGLHLIGGNSAFFLSPIIAAAILGAFGEDDGWRYSYLILAVFTAVFSLIFLIYLSRRGGRAHVEAVKQKIVTEKPPQPGYKRRLIAFMIMVIINGGISFSVIQFLTLYMTDDLGASHATAAGLIAIISSSGLWAGPVGGYISDKIGSVKIVIATGILLGVFLYSFKFVELGFSLYLVLFLLGLNMAVNMPVTEVFLMAQAPARHRSKLFGVYYSTMHYTGAIFALPSGYLIERLGFDAIFTWSAIVVGTTAIITSLLIFDAKDHYQSEKGDIETA
jgi:FSR family fosmidomycin resistance protein-like MFS transporter